MSKPPLILSSIDDSNSVRLDSDSSMSNGVVTIRKIVNFKVPDGQNPRIYNDLDVYGHTNFPAMYSALSDDVRYVFYGNCSITHGCGGNGNYFSASIEYSTKNPNATDVDGSPVTNNTKPWKLRPDNVEFSPYSTDVAFTEAYDNDNAVIINGTTSSVVQGGTTSVVITGSTIQSIPMIPVVNTAGDKFIFTRKANALKLSFQYNVQYFSIANILKYVNTINMNQIVVCGATINARCGIINNITATPITVYKDNSSTVLWDYWRVAITILIDKDNLFRSERALNVGDRAYFPDMAYTDALITSSITLKGTAQGNVNKASQICRWRKYQAITVGGKTSYSQIGDAVFGSWEQFIAFRQEAIARSAIMAENDANYNGGIVDPQCEQCTQMPLTNTSTSKGFLDTTAIENKTYSELQFCKYPIEDWLDLNLPAVGAKETR